MKKIISLLLSLSLLLSMVVMPASATEAGGNWNGGTQVSYDAEADNDGDGVADSSEAYTVTVPAQLAPGQSGNVVLAGTWPSNRIVNVNAESSVRLTNNINPANEKNLEISFEPIEQAGSNISAIEVSKEISVENIDKAIFGTWSGRFNYQVSVDDAPLPPPEKNEFGFYYNVPYVHEHKLYEGYSEEYVTAYVFYPDNTMVYFTYYEDWDTNEKIYGLFACENEWTFTYDESTRCLKESRHVYEYQFAADGESFVMQEEEYVAAGVEHGVYYSREYVSDDGDVYVFTQDDGLHWGAKNHMAADISSSYYISIDGEVLIVDGKLFYKGGYGEPAEPIIEMDGLFDANGVQLASWYELTRDYNLGLSFGDHNAFWNATNSLGYYLYHNPEFATATKLIVGKNVKNIGSYGLNSCDQLEEIVLPDGLQSIGWYSMSGATNLAKLEIPNTVTSISANAITNSEAITTIVIPDSVEVMGNGNEYAISSCSKLETLTLGDGLTELTTVVTGCQSLKTVEIGSNVKKIRYAAFYDCNAIETFKFNGTVEEWNDIELQQSWDGSVFNQYCGVNEIICIDGITCIVHTGSDDPTCSTKPICEVCGYGYGQKLAHSYVVDENASHEKHDEYEHKISATCSECGDKGYVFEYHNMEEDESPTYSPDQEYYDTWSHWVSAHCSQCGEVGHVYEQHDSTEGEIMYLSSESHSTHYSCKKCHMDYWRKLSHSGGTSDCVTLAVCDHCNREYGEYGLHKIEGDTCVLCNVVGTVIETDHPYSKDRTNQYKILGTWDYSDAKSVYIEITWQTGSNTYGDGIFITKGTDFVPGSSGSIKEYRYYLARPSLSETVLSGSVIGVNYYNAGSYNNAKFWATDQRTATLTDVDMLTGTVGIDAYNGGSYGVRIVIIPNY